MELGLGNVSAAEVQGPDDLFTASLPEPSGGDTLGRRSSVKDGAATTTAVE